MNEITFVPIAGLRGRKYILHGVKWHVNFAGSG